MVNIKDMMPKIKGVIEIKDMISGSKDAMTEIKDETVEIRDVMVEIEDMVRIKDMMVGGRDVMVRVKDMTIRISDMHEMKDALAEVRDKAEAAMLALGMMVRIGQISSSNKRG